MGTALDGIKVLDLGNMVSGPYCTKILADYGADVIKIEKPGLGDDARSVGPFPNDRPDLEKSGLFLYLNTNKKSITLNLKSASGAKIFKDLVKQVDVVVENFSPSVMPSLGLDYETLQKVNPRLVMTSVTNLGQTGPWRDYEAMDLQVWALSGILKECGDADREPLRIGSEQTQFVAGLYGVLTTLSALYYRDETGIGQHLDVSAWEAYQTTEPYQSLLVSQFGGLSRQRMGVNWPFGIHACQDGYVGFFLPTQEHWEMLCTLMEMAELKDRPGFETPLEREQHVEEIRALIDSWLKDKRMVDVFHDSEELRLPISPIPNMGQILELAQHRARGYFVDIEHPVAGKLTYPGPFFRLSETPWQAGRAPLLGEHNEEIYGASLGYSKEQLVRLRATGII